LKKVDPIKASDMHGHMLDFKKRGGYIRNKLRKLFGIYSPSYGYKPKKISLSRIFVEIIISLIFRVGKTGIARWIISKIPDSYIGPIFDKLRLFWKSISRPTKRKGLSEYKVILGDY
jgi:coenzyme F420 hydrogenase subunit beta